ncbi:MAG: FAD-dependent oxidoreductase [Actinomycetota bacterium]
MRIAIVGSGIAGLTCAHVLGPEHDTVLFEADERLGGHANTIEVDDPAAGPLGVDTGFIVHNDRNYPNLCRLFDELDIAVIDTEMSFAVTDRPSGFTYRATNPNTLFADRSNLTSVRMWRMVYDIFRFYRRANRYLSEGRDDQTLAEFVADGSYGDEFVDLHLIPMGAAVWSADPRTFDQFPASALFRFLANHGLLSVGDRPQWRTVAGGSRRYVRAVAERFRGDVRTGTPVHRVTTDSNGVEVRFGSGGEQSEHFDRVVLCCHSDDALRMLADATDTERAVLGAIGYRTNTATLHTDVALLSPQRRAWAAWNYDRLGPDDADPAVTYDLTTLQRLPGEHRYLVTLNSDARIDPASILHQVTYRHPEFNRAATDAQARFDEIDGTRGVHYAGAYWGYGFHEDGMVAGLRACERIGVTW